MQRCFCVFFILALFASFLGSEVVTSIYLIRDRSRFYDAILVRLSDHDRRLDKHAENHLDHMFKFHTESSTNYSSTGWYATSNGMFDSSHVSISSEVR